MRILTSLNPVGVAIINTETDEIEEIYKCPTQNEYHRIYGIQQIDGDVYIGYTNELIKLRWEDKEIMWEFKDPKFCHVHSVTRAWDGRIWVTSTLNDRCYKLNEFGEVIETFFAGDYFPKPSWYVEYPNWHETNISTINQWTHINYFMEPSEGCYRYSFFHRLGNNKEVITTGEVGTILKNMPLIWRTRHNLLKNPHCLVLADGYQIIANSGNNEILFFDTDDVTIEEAKTREEASIILPNIRAHHIEPIGMWRVLITDCRREDPGIILYNIAKRKIEWDWRVPKDLFASAKDKNMYVQPYVAKLFQ